MQSQEAELEPRRMMSLQQKLLQKKRKIIQNPMRANHQLQGKKMMMFQRKTPLKLQDQEMLRRNPMATKLLKIPTLINSQKKPAKKPQKLPKNQHPQPTKQKLLP